MANEKVTFEEACWNILTPDVEEIPSWILKWVFCEWNMEIRLD